MAGHDTMFRGRLQIEEDRAKTAKMFLNHYTQEEIAKKLGITNVQVSIDMKIIRKRWVEEQLTHYGEAMAVEIMKLNALESVFARAWDKSKLPSISYAADGSIIETESTGDIRFLQGIERCIEKRCRLLGLDKGMSGEKNHGSSDHDGTLGGNFGLAGMLNRMKEAKVIINGAKEMRKNFDSATDADHEENH